MFDSVDIAEIPKTAHAVAGYVGGSWPTDSHDALRAKFPNAFVVSIATDASQSASVLDIETGDANIGQLREWMTRMVHQGWQRPCAYGSRSIQNQVPAALRNIDRKSYRRWLADPTGSAHCPADMGACQFDWHFLNRNLDASLCQPWFFTLAERPLNLSK